jgi:hypothetical protein
MLPPAWLDSRSWLRQILLLQLATLMLLEA